MGPLSQAPLQFGRLLARQITSWRSELYFRSVEVRIADCAVHLSPLPRLTYQPSIKAKNNSRNI